jgi:two-component system, OmpR family, phosphate regulon response regulator OmpR
VSVESAHILVVDDDDRLRDLLKKYLSDNGFRVTAAEDAQAARAKMASIAFDLIVLDRMMPGETGLEFAAAIRDSNTVPILMLTAMAETDDRISGLEVGADDYLTKPFEPRELLLRINSILRRLPVEVDKMVPTEARLGEFVFNLEREELRQGNDVIGLTTAEARLLKILAEKPGAIFSRDYLMDLVAPGGGERTVDVQVNRLRHKIEPDPKLPRYLQTVRGQGYILRPD